MCVKTVVVSILQVTVFMSRTFNRRQGLIAGGVVAAVHLLFLLYLHFAYHSVYEGQSLFNESSGNCHCQD